MSEAIVVGAVKYLNTRPLIHGLDQEAGVRVRREVPGDLAPLLAGGEVDVALLPVIEYFRMAANPAERARPHPRGDDGTGRRPPTQLVVLPVAAIASRGAIGSIRLFGYAEKHQLRRVLLDPASRTSNALARLIVRRRFGVEPHFLMPDELGPEPVRPVDAELMIGDRALAAERPSAEWITDLGVEWHRFTYLPFVFAFWVARADAPVERIAALLAAARDRGLAAREAIADEAAGPLGIPAEVARRYLLEQVRYTFGPKEQEGLRAFYRMAAEEGLAPEGVRLRLAPGAAATE